MGATLTSVRVVSGGTDTERVAHATSAAAVNPTSTRPDAHASRSRVREVTAAAGASACGSLRASSISSRASAMSASLRRCGPSRGSAEAGVESAVAWPPAARSSPARARGSRRSCPTRVSAGERGAAGQHFVEHAAERPDVGTFVDRPAPRLLRDSCRRRCRGSRPSRVRPMVTVGGLRRSRRAALVARNGLRQAEVEHLHDAVGRDLDVGRLQIAMDDPLARARLRARRRSAARSPSASASGIGPCAIRSASVCPSTSSSTKRADAVRSSTP